LFFAAITGLTGCATDSAPPSSTADNSPVITAPAGSASETPVTMSGYVETSGTAQVK
jgi:hypothetical protein